MTQSIIIPDIGDFESVEIIEVLVKVGDQINKDDPIVTLESDKSSVEVPSPFSGKILELNVKIGDKVSKGTLLAKLTNGVSDVYEKKINQKNITVTEEKNIHQDKVKDFNPNKIKKVFAQPSAKDDIDPVETKEWIDSLNNVVENDGPTRASYLLNKIISEAYAAGLVLPDTKTTPYINTIPPELEAKSPGDQNI